MSNHLYRRCGFCSPLTGTNPPHVPDWISKRPCSTLQGTRKTTMSMSKWMMSAHRPPRLSITTRASHWLLGGLRRHPRNDADIGSLPFSTRIASRATGMTSGQSASDPRSKKMRPFADHPNIGLSDDVHPSLDYWTLRKVLDPVEGRTRSHGPLCLQTGSKCLGESHP